MDNRASKKPLLSIDGICKLYGQIEVLHDIGFDIYSGEVVALLGENGAGKSTVSNIISGSVQPSSGQMNWLGENYTPASPKNALEIGIAMIHQELLLLPDLSIAENMFIGRYPVKYGRIDRKEMEVKARKGLQRLGLDISPWQKIEGLSTAKQQLIEIAKALTLKAKLIIFDEPTASLGGEETKLLFEQITRLKNEGVGIVYISHRLEEIKQIADRIIVFRDGRKVKEFETADIDLREIIESMVGRSLDQMFPELPSPVEKNIYEVKNLSSPDGRFTDVNFAVKQGEIFGIAGLVGAGRTELVRALAGVDPIATGSVLLEGCEVTPSSPSDAIKNGVILVPEDRKLHGLVLIHSIEENIFYSNRDRIANKGWVNGLKIKTFGDYNIEKFGVKGSGKQLVSSLSGGNQQKVVLAKWLARNPKVVLLDEPTRGIDVGARSAIYDLIRELADRGVAVVVVSSDLEEVLGISNRVMVMVVGKQGGILDHKDANDVKIMELATSS